MDKEKIGFIGLGNMGFPMASNLLKKGFNVYGIDQNKEREQQFTEIGGESNSNLDTIFQEANFIFTSLPTPQVVEKVYFGENGLIQNSQKGTVIIDLSTISPELNQNVAQAAEEKGISYLGAPVSGSVSGAEAATLCLMVGGDKQIFDKVLPLLEAIGENIFHIGEDPGQGTVVKLINNLLAGIHAQAASEALALAAAANIDQEQLVNIVNVSSGQSAVLSRNYHHFIAQDEYIKGGFSNQLLLKDLRLVNQVANSLDGKLPIGEKLIDYLTENLSGYENKDISSTYLMLAKQKVEQ